jgi:hypothetical protein
MLRNTWRVTDVKAGAFIILLVVTCIFLLGASRESNVANRDAQWEYCRALHFTFTGDVRKTFDNQTFRSREPRWWFTPGCVSDKDIDKAEPDVVLKYLGVNGWQLVSVNDEGRVSGIQQTLFYFMRPKR